MLLPPYPPETNSTESLWATIKGKLKLHQMMTEETLSSRIAGACNEVLLSGLYSFSSHSKVKLIINKILM